MLLFLYLCKVMLNLTNILKHFQNFDMENEVKKSLLKSENDMLTLNENQMLLQGEDSDGNQLQTYKSAPGEVYAAYTIELKKEKGQRTDIVTLHDSGHFHESMELYKDAENLPIEVNGMFPIIADFKKGSENISKNIDTSNVLGLNEQNMNAIINDVQNEIYKQVEIFISQTPEI